MSVEIEGAKSSTNLWETCVIGPHGDAACSYRYPDVKHDFQNEITGEWDGAIAGCILGALFTIFVLLCSCCKNKCGMVTNACFALVFVAAAVGCWVRVFYITNAGSFDQSGLLKLGAGFYVECGGLVMLLVTTIVACMAPKKSSYVHFQSYNMA